MHVIFTADIFSVNAVLLKTIGWIHQVYTPGRGGGYVVIYCLYMYIHRQQFSWALARLTPMHKEHSYFVYFFLSALMEWLL